MTGHITSHTPPVACRLSLVAGRRDKPPSWPQLAALSPPLPPPLHPAGHSRHPAAMISRIPGRALLRGQCHRPSANHRPAVALGGGAKTGCCRLRDDGNRPNRRSPPHRTGSQIPSHEDDEAGRTPSPRPPTAECRRPPNSGDEAEPQNRPSPSRRNPAESGGYHRRETTPASNAANPTRSRIGRDAAGRGVTAPTRSPRREMRGRHAATQPALPACGSM